MTDSFIVKLRFLLCRPTPSTSLRFVSTPPTEGNYIGGYSDMRDVAFGLGDRPYDQTDKANKNQQSPTLVLGPVPTTKSGGTKAPKTKGVQQYA